MLLHKLKWNGILYLWEHMFPHRAKEGQALFAAIHESFNETY